MSAAAENDRLGFVLHLGDFIYEIVWYPEDRPQGMYDRRVCETSFAMNTARSFAISISLQPSLTIAQSTVPICTIRTCRMRAHDGRSSTCGTTMSSAGRAGSLWRSSMARRFRGRRAKSQPIRRSSNINLRDCPDLLGCRWSDSTRRLVVDAPDRRSSMNMAWAWSQTIVRH